MVTARIAPLRVQDAVRAPGRAAVPLGLAPGSSPATPPTTCTSLVLDPNVHIQETKALACDIRPGRRPRGPALRRAGATPTGGGRASRETTGMERGGHADRGQPRMGFFTDTSVCIGCKACEVACKEWNAVPEDGLTLTGMSFDNTGRARRRAPGGTWRSSSSRSPPHDEARGRRERRRRVALADGLRRVQALHPRRLPGRLPDRARCSAPSSAPSSCRRTSATAAATASPPARSA